MFIGELVTLGLIQREYLPRYMEWLNDWEIRRFLAPMLAQPYAIEDEEEWFNHQRQAKNDWHFAILTREQGLLLGNCGLHQIDSTNRHAILGIFIGDKNYWSKGYGTDATRTLLRFAFQEANHIASSWKCLRSTRARSARTKKSASSWRVSANRRSSARARGTTSTSWRFCRTSGLHSTARVEPGAVTFHALHKTLRRSCEFLLTFTLDSIIITCNSKSGTSHQLLRRHDQALITANL